MADEAPPPRAPAKLGTAGRRLWRAVVDEFADFGPHHLAVLELAARQADDLAALEKLLRDQGLVVTGSTGRPRLSAIITELRQGRLALGKLLSQLPLPDGTEDDDAGQSESSKRAQHAANARWAKVRRLDDMRARARG